MKKIFLEPSVEVIEFSKESLVTMSNGNTDVGDDNWD